VWPYSKGERDETAIFGEGGRRGPAEFRVIPEPQFRVLIQRAGAASKCQVRTKSFPASLAAGSDIHMSSEMIKRPVTS